MSYRHGAYGEIITSQEKITSGQGVVPFYVGTAPIFRCENYKDKTNNPILIRSLEDAQIKLGYSESDDFEEFTLSAVIYGHFRNKIEPIGPIVVVNVLDPITHTKDLNATITLINKIAYLDNCLDINSVKVNGKSLGVDYKLEYEDGKVKFIAISELQSPLAVSYKAIDPKKVAEADIIGNYSQETNSRSGIQCLETVYEDLNVIPNIISAPGFNHKTKVEQALIATSIKYDNHFDAIVVTDIDSIETDTIEKALEWKKKNNYGSNREKVCWPRAKVGDKVLWKSIIAIVRMQQTDNKNKGIPYESPSNKPVDISALVAGKDNITFKMNSVLANKLNEKGITTALFSGGKWVLWGPHMANYDYLTTDKADEIFDVNIRMNIYLSNDFQLRNTEIIDKPIARNDLDGILNSEQLRLNSLIADGKLLYGKIDFIPESNPVSDLIQGDFKFDTMVTNTPPGKSLINRIQYTSKGINSLLGGEKK